MHFPYALVGVQLADAVQADAGVPRAHGQQVAVGRHARCGGGYLVFCTVSAGPGSEGKCFCETVCSSVISHSSTQQLRGRKLF